MLGQKRYAAHAVKTVGGLENFDLETVGRAENIVDLVDPCETRAAGFNGEDIVLRAGLGEQRPGRDQARDIVHLGPVQDARNVVVYAVLEAEYAIAKSVQVARDHSCSNARIESGCKSGACAAAGNSHAANVRG